MTCTAEVNINFISTSHHHKSGVLEQFFCKRFAFDRYFYHELQKKEKTFCKLHKSVFRIETVAILFFFFFCITSEVKDPFSNVDFYYSTQCLKSLSFGTSVDMFEPAAAMVCCHSTGKIMIIITKIPLNACHFPFPCASSSAATQDIIL